MVRIASKYVEPKFLLNFKTISGGDVSTSVSAALFYFSLSNVNILSVERFHTSKLAVFYEQHIPMAYWYYLAHHCDSIHPRLS